MNLGTFFENYEVLADAPNGVYKLRELIFQLAVQGKLVPQDPYDEPATVLIEKITAEKERLIKEGKISKSKPLPAISVDKIYFELPYGWQWVRFDDVCSYTQRGKGPKYVEKSDIPVVSQKCIQWDGFKLDRARFISPSSLEKYNEQRFLRTGDLLWNSTGTGTIGRVNVYVHEDNSYDKVVADSHVTVVRPILLNSRFIYCWIASPMIQNEIEEMASGTTNQIELNLSTIKNHLVPLPPLQEQDRIVAKVDQLMALCDELEARQQKKHEQRILLNNAALDKLLTAPTPGEFAQHWQRICDNFDLLYDAPETVGQLRQSILQLAVQGKLVVQDEGDEPATVLLEKIASEKDQLVKENKIKRIRALPPIDPRQIPYELPYNWEWVRLGDVGHDCGQKKPDKKFTYIDVSAINKEQGIISDEVDILEPREAPSRARKLVSKGSVIYATVRPYLLNIAIIDKTFEPEPIVSTAFAVLHPYSGILNKYLYYYLRSKPFIKYVESEMIGMAYPAINDGKLYMGLVPIPPFEEQQRIVAKVDQLMALCDELESGLVQAQTDGGKLMEAVVHQLCGDSQL